MYASGAQRDNAFIMEEQLADGAISGFERSILLKIRRVKARDSTIFISDPKKLLICVESERRYWSW
jgi:hypothetical protein